MPILTIGKVLIRFQNRLNKKLGQGNVHKRQERTLMGFRTNFDKSVDKDMYIKSDKGL